MIFSILAAIALQDPAAQARDWARKLDEEQPEVREQAERELIKLGTSALPVLRDLTRSADPEVGARAQRAIEEILRAEKLSKVFRAPKTVSIDMKDAPLREVVAELGRQSGLRFQAATAQESRVSLRLRDAPLLQALDEISRQLPESTLRFIDDKTVGAVSEKHVSFPTAYSGPFRLRLTRVERRVIHTFDKITCEVALSLATDWEKTVQPMDQYHVELLDAVDDRGRKLTLQETRPEEPMVRRGWRAPAPQPPQEEAAVFPDVDPAAGALDKIRARATFRFPLEVQQVRFVDPKVDDERAAGEYVVKVHSIDRNYIMINVQCRSEQAMAAASECFDFGSFEIVDSNGTVSKTEVASSGQFDARTFQFYALTRRASVKEFRFNLRDIVTRTFEFEFGRLELPR
jgi:hypothetical protein